MSNYKYPFEKSGEWTKKQTKLDLSSLTRTQLEQFIEFQHIELYEKNRQVSYLCREISKIKKILEKH